MSMPVIRDQLGHSSPRRDRPLPELWYCISGRETAGHLVSAGAESVQVPGRAGLLTRADLPMLPLDA
jgi:hypothetical protein